MHNQNERIFFGENDPYNRKSPTQEDMKWMVDSGNPSSPFSHFIGNERAVKKMQVAAFTALSRFNHVMCDLSFALFGPSSAGKTTLAKLYAECVELPFVEISPRSIKTLDDFFKAISKVCLEEGLGLVEVEKLDNYHLPPLVILLDEVHALSDGIIQGLLKATEFKDGILVTESGKSINCKNVTWMCATTDEGKLFDAFRTRFDPINLDYLSKTDVGRVIKLNNPDFSESACNLIAHFNSRIVRQALSFSRYVKMRMAMEGGTLEENIKQVAKDEGIDEYGMRKIHLKILTSLSHGPIAKNRMSNLIGRKDEEVERYILPWLLVSTEDQEAYISVSSRGYVLTESGHKELERRGL